VTLPELRPPGVGRAAWALGRLASTAAVRHGVGLVSTAALLIASGALLAQALDRPDLVAFQRSRMCAGATNGECQAWITGRMIEESELLGFHRVTLDVQGRVVVLYGSGPSSDRQLIGRSSEVLLVTWRGRAARIFGSGLQVDAFEGPRGWTFLMTLVFLASVLVAIAANLLESVALRLHARALAWRSPPAGANSRPWALLAFVVCAGLLVLPLRLLRWDLALPVHLVAGSALVLVSALVTLRWGQRAWALAGRGLDALSEEGTLAAGGTLLRAAAVLAVSLALTVDAVVSDLVRP
jgi:hypothetical protein